MDDATEKKLIESVQRNWEIKPRVFITW
jgi:hypothetical protein